MKKIIILIALLIACNAYATKDAHIQSVSQTTNEKTEISENQKQSTTHCYCCWEKCIKELPLPIIIASLGALTYKGDITPMTFAISSFFTFLIFSRK